MYGKTHVKLIGLSALAILFGVGFLLLLRLDTGDNVATLTLLEAEYEADKRPPDISPVRPPENVPANDDREVVASVTESLSEQRDESLVLEAEHEVNLAVNKSLPQGSREDFSVLAEREVDLRTHARLPRRPGEPLAIDVHRAVDGQKKANRRTQSASVEEPVNEPSLSPLSIVDASNKVRERTVLNSDGQIDVASPNEQLGPVRAESPPEAQPSVENQDSPTPEAKSAGRIVTEQEARLALQGVGYDPISEMLWIAAINDPNLSSDVRKNLIEDLNEDGFPDFRNITIDDLPLIMTRMALIEELFFDAMDEANTEALLEAYKDLGNMYGRLTNW